MYEWPPEADRSRLTKNFSPKGRLHTWLVAEYPLGGCGSGGIGRRAGLRILCLTAWGFDSPLPHHLSLSMPALIRKWPQLCALLILCACVDSPPEIPAGETPLKWLEDIESFEAEALLEPVPLEAALFIGSSSIRRWDTLQEDMAPLPIIKRGFGGSRLFDSIYWADRLVLAHDPAVIVMFSGTNDIKGEEPKSAVQVRELFEQFVRRIRRAWCRAPIVYIAINPSMARIEHLDIVIEANRQIARFCERDPSLHFVDTAAALLDEHGLPDPQWFLEDELHLNPAGYALWSEQIKPLVARLLDAAR